MVVGSDPGRLPAPKVIELCDAHGGPVADLAVLYAQAPDSLNGSAKPARAKPGPKPKDGDLSQLDRMTQDGVTIPPSWRPAECPVCNTVIHTRANLAAHIWRRHHNRPKPTAPVVCPECGREGMTPASMGIHRARMHGYDSAANALNGLPGWSAKRIARWLADSA